MRSITNHPDFVPRPRATTPPRHRRGTIMFEILLILPFILLVFLLVLYFGSALARAQKAWVLDRYEAWRQADNGTGPRAQSPGSAQLNDLFYKGQASGVQYDADHYFPMDSPNELENVANRDFGQPSAKLVDEYHRRFDRGRRVQFSVRHYHDPDHLYSRFDGPIVHRHTRIGSDWKFANGWRVVDGEWEHSDGGGDGIADADTTGPWIIPILRDEYIDDFDQAMEDMAGQDNPMAKYLRQHYLFRPGYRGPTVRY